MRGPESARKKPLPSWRIALRWGDVYNRRRRGSRVALRQRSISLRVPAPFIMGLRNSVWATNTQRMRTIALTGEKWALGTFYWPSFCRGQGAELIALTVDREKAEDKVCRDTARL